MARHVCKNYYHDLGTNGGCYVEIGATKKEGIANLNVGWSCVVVHDKEIPVTWLAELVAIATAHDGGISGFLKSHDYGSPSYALMCDPPEPQSEPSRRR